MKPQRIEPGPGQESVWDYPRPPRVEPSDRRVEIHFNGRKIADSTNAVRVLETSHPPVYYVPLEDFDEDILVPSAKRTFCEFKGNARYYHVEVDGERADNVAWTYPDPVADYGSLEGRVAVYPGRMEACLLDGERVKSQQGDFYGGWITGEIVGPFKGGAGTWGW